MLKKIVFTICFLVVYGCPLCAQTPTMPKARYVSPSEAKVLGEKNENIVFVDVRQPEEFKAGHIEDAINIPYEEIEKHPERFRNEKTYILYCIRSSWRAPYTANLLADLGIHNVYVLRGGIAAWNAGEQIIISSDPDQKAGIAPYPKDLQKNLKHPTDRIYDGTKELTEEELSFYDGLDGRPAYVAVNGIIYDLTNSRLWRGGEHAPSHGDVQAGTDVTKLLADSPHGDKHLKNFSIVGRLLIE